MYSSQSVIPITFVSPKAAIRDPSGEDWLGLRKTEMTQVANDGRKRAPLTRREVEVSALVSQGLPNKTVAYRLGLREGTVKLHLHNIYRKLGLSGRTGLILALAKRERKTVPLQKNTTQPVTPNLPD